MGGEEADLHLLSGLYGQRTECVHLFVFYCVSVCYTDKGQPFTVFHSHARSYDTRTLHVAMSLKEQSVRQQINMWPGLANSRALQPHG